MPFHQNSIGSFQFLSMDGAVYPRQQQKELIERSGVGGTGARKLGIRGRPFELLTTNYEQSLIAAEGKLQEYADLCDEDVPIAVVKNGVPEGSFILLEVRERARFAIFNAVGGFEGGEECQHEVIWTMVG
jgi:hypothetical protein